MKKNTFRIMRLITNRNLLWLIALLSFSIVVTAVLRYTDSSNQRSLPERGYIQISNQLSSQQIKALAEDQNGYIWIGTERGLDRYDGDTYIQYFSTTDTLSLPNQDLISLKFMDHHPDWMMIATFNGTCVLFPDGTCQPLEGNLSGIAEVGDSLLLCYSNNLVSLYSLNSSARRYNKIRQLQLQETVDELLVGPDSIFWLQTGKHWEQYDIDFNHKSRSQIKLGNNSSILIDQNRALILTQDGYRALNLTDGSWGEDDLCQFINAHLGSPDDVLRTYYYNNVLAIAKKSSPIISLINLEKRTLQQDYFEGLKETEVGSVFTDSHGNLWCGSRSMGLETHFANRAAFTNNSELCRFFADKDVTSITYDQQGRLWVLISRTNLYMCDTDGRIHDVDLSSLPDRYMLHLANMDNGHLLVSMMRRVVECETDAAGRLHVVNSLSTPFSIYAVMEDSQGRIWLGSHRGCYIADLKQGTVQRIPTKLGRTNMILELHDNRLLAGSLESGVSLIDPTTFTEKHFDLPLDKPGMFSCRDITEDRHGNIWIATNGMGVHKLDLETGNVTNYRAQNMCTDVSCILAESDGDYVWMGTLDGLSKLDPVTGQFLTFYEADGVQGNEFFERCAVNGPDGTLVFGGKRGITLFNPNEVTANESDRLCISHITVNQQLLYVGDDAQGYRLDSVDGQMHLTLPYDFSNLEFKLSTLNYGAYARSTIFYRMSGIDDDWNFASSPSVSYYSLPPGHYTFQARTVDQNGQPLCAIEIPVTISPQWWMSWWLKWVTYPLLGLFVLLFIALLIRINIKRRHRIRDAIREKVAIRYASDMNMRFFTNMAHEFRTPLTLIYGANGMLGKSQVSNDERHAISIITSNTNRLLGLVNQLLDFNKLEHDMVKLCVQPTKVESIVNQLIQMYQLGFKERDIQLSTQYIGSKELVWIDPDKYDKILGNLLSNALKFTPKGGMVSITITIGEDRMTTEVCDTGIGIPDNMLESIFDRYYQTSEGAMKQNATGIGLCYSRGLAQLHHGTIIARHNPLAEQGSSFLLTLPILREAYLDSELNPHAESLVPQMEDDVAESADVSPAEETVTDQEALAPEVPTILVVDDEPEVINFMRLILEKTYHVVTENSATEAIAHMPQLKPDLIVSDVMMLGMDGYKFCQLLKEDIAYCHIPVILLTAKVSLEERVQGFNVGADAYITKPFEPAYLLALIKSQLENRQRIQHLLSTSTDALKQSVGNENNEEEKPQVTPQDAAFLEKFYQFMEQHLSDAELNMNELLDLVGMSRSKLYYKVKGLTGQTPNAFFKIYKLNRAAEMIKEGDKKLAYIAELIGFCGPSHFTTSFKKQFGVLPSEYGHLESE